MSDLKEGKGNRVWEGEQPSSTKTEKEERKRRKPDVENILSGGRKKIKEREEWERQGGRKRNVEVGEARQEGQQWATVQLINTENMNHGFLEPGDCEWLELRIRWKVKTKIDTQIGLTHLFVSNSKKPAEFVMFYVLNQLPRSPW